MLEVKVSRDYVTDYHTHGVSHHWLSDDELDRLRRALAHADVNGYAEVADLVELFSEIKHENREPPILSDADALRRLLDNPTDADVAARIIEFYKGKRMPEEISTRLVY